MNVEKLFYKYNQMLFRICLVMLCNEADAQDAVQDTFYRYLLQKKHFSDEEHEKAWLIRVAVNRCWDEKRKRARHPQIDWDSISSYYRTEDERMVMDAFFRLPEKWKAVVHLHYVEGYRVKEIAAMLHLSENAVKKRLQRGREWLRENLED